jgi:hypothetical protein
MRTGPFLLKLANGLTGDLKNYMTEMHGKITVEFDRQALKDLCSKYVAGYDVARFEVVAIRIFCAKEIVLTIYAEDKLNTGSGLGENKFPVKKFKKEIRSHAEFFEFVRAFNFTISAGDYNMEDMEVINR